MSLPHTHTYTHSGVCDHKEGRSGWRIRYESLPCMPPLPTFNPLVSFITFTCSAPRLRPQTATPSETSELSINLTVWADVSKSKSPYTLDPFLFSVHFPPTSSEYQQSSGLVRSSFHVSFFHPFQYSLLAPLK